MAHTTDIPSYKNTLNLPSTDFPIRSAAATEDPLMIQRWEEEELYKKTFEKNKGNQKFILHDGPPYANAHIHLGTAYNKILKDIIAKFERMSGKHVPVTPGWDCHGLPIELKVTQLYKDLHGESLKKACRAYALEWIEIQKKEFKELGVCMDWEHPYLTMSFDYEAKTVEAFKQFVEQGYISRKNKTVPWCASCSTVLAAAEIEYYDKKDPSLYVLFKLIGHAFTDITLPVFCAVWTTTPWTLPLNRAVFLKTGATYVILQLQDKAIIVAEALADSLCALLQVPKIILHKFLAEALLNMLVEHPFIKNFSVPVLTDHFVGLSDGTACVHCAPGCGPEDYEVGLKNNLEIFSPLSADGSYTKGIIPTELEGTKVSDALSYVITALQQAGTLLYKTSINHSFPHCWRCRNGLLFRATRQWFCELNHEGLQERSLEAIKKINMLPDAMRNHLKSAIGGRLEWCLSRQRTWGIPIVSLLCTKCDQEYMTSEMLQYVIEGIKKEGIEYWDKVTVQELLFDKKTCTDCGNNTFKKEQAILDVWFDSGISHYAVLKGNSEVNYPADLYLEGIDQHRGWFQSSLLTSMALEKNVPSMKEIITHGYTVDDKGKKMSKSLGNVIAPQELINRMGTDALRLWVSSIELQGDVVVSEKLLTNIQESYRKIRNTCRFLLQNLYDFNEQQDLIADKDLLTIDHYALTKLLDFETSVLQAYKNRSLTGVYHEFIDYVTGSLSSFYLDIIKDRLYTDIHNGLRRKSAQTVCFYILQSLTTLMAPILSFTAEHLSDYYQKDKKESIHLQNFFSVRDILTKVVDMRYEEQWKMIRYVRGLVLKAIELIRQKNIVKHSLEARVALIMKQKTTSTVLIKDFLYAIDSLPNQETKQSFLKEFFIVSEVDIFENDIDNDFYNEEDSEQVYDENIGLIVKVAHAKGSKCPRCWQWEVSSHEHQLCNRCIKIVESLKV